MHGEETNCNQNTSKFLSIKTMTHLQENHFSFSNTTHGADNHLPEVQLHAWSTEAIGPNKNQSIKEEQQEKEFDIYELSLRDLVVNFPRILSYQQEREKKVAEIANIKRKKSKSSSIFKSFTKMFGKKVKS